MSVDDLDRYVTSQTAIASTINRGHAAVTEHGKQLVLIQLYVNFLRRFHARPVRMHLMVVPFRANAQLNALGLGRWLASSCQNELPFRRNQRIGRLAAFIGDDD